MPLVPQTLDDNDPQGKDPVLKNTESVRIQGAFTALKTVIKACSDAGLYVLLDIHSCSNYLGWRAGRFDSKPPFADGNRDNYDYKREDCSCSASGNPSTVTRIQAYDQPKWVANLKTLAGLGSSIGVDNIIGIDIFNEPYDYTWTEWKALIDTAYTTVSAVNSNILIFAQGIGNKSTFGNSNNPNWGENLYEAVSDPPSMPKNKLVYSPHTYGPSVCTQGFFADLNVQPECADLQEDEFGDAKCQIKLDPAVLESGWETHFGFLRDEGYAICIGEFGGNREWPNKSEQRHQTRYSYLTDKTTDWQWQNAFVNWLVKRKIGDSIYWSINPESSDTYGIYTTPYDPLSNTGGWGTWSGTDSQKLSLIKKLWDVPFLTGTETPAPTTVVTTPDPTTVSGTPVVTPVVTPVPGTPAPTAGIGVGSVSFSPANSTAITNSTVQVSVVVNTGSQTLAAYGITVTWSSSLLTLTSAAAGPGGWDPVTNIKTGTATLAGFDASGLGKGPSNALQILVLTFSTGSSEGISSLEISVDSLVDGDANTIGNPNGVAGSVTISNSTGGLLGDVNGDDQVGIVDALWIAQYYVNNPPAGFIAENADVNKDGNITITDALRVAQCYVGLVSCDF
jgi:aryl-phospho-beta-D-glucosidase BglC (GH1 family)